MPTDRRRHRSDPTVSAARLSITPVDSAARSPLIAMWSMLLRPLRPTAEVAIVMPGGMACSRAVRRSAGTAWPCPILRLKSPATIRGLEESLPSTPAEPSRYSRRSSHIRRFSVAHLTRDPDHGIQTPTTVTCPSDVSVMPETNLPGGMDAAPRSSTFSHGRLDQRATFLRGGNVAILCSQSNVRLGKANDLWAVHLNAPENLGRPP